PSMNKPVVLSASDAARFETDVVFAGHYEADGRQRLVEMLVESGIRLRLFGPEWERPARESRVLRRFSPVDSPRGEDYNKALCGAKIALCFLSKLNRDTYTRRCFEIPAAGVFLLAEYSDDLGGLFKEGVQAEFFRGPDELLRKAR